MTDRKKSDALDERPLPPGGDVGRPASKHKPTGEGTAPPSRDVADPHPSDEEHPYRERHPGGARPPDVSREIGPNPAVHDGDPPPRPDNAETGD